MTELYNVCCRSGGEKYVLNTYASLAFAKSVTPKGCWVEIATYDHEGNLVEEVPYAEN